MLSNHSPDGKTNQPMIYQIRVQGHLGSQWARQLADQFEELSITLEDDGTTLLTGPMVDQAALHGILRKVRDLGIILLAVNSLDDSPHDPSM